MPENVKKDLCEQSIIEESQPLGPHEEAKALHLEDYGEKVKVRVDNNTPEAVGNYEFSMVPRSLFAADGTLPRCSRKSALMDISEKLPVDLHEDNDPGVNQNGQHTEV